MALSAITIASLAFFPGTSESWRKEIITLAVLHMVGHVFFSIVKYYGTSNIPAITEFPLTMSHVMHSDPVTRGKGIKKLSVIFGVMAELSIFATYFEVITSVMTAGILIVTLSMLHFTSMEVDIKLQL